MRCSLQGGAANVLGHVWFEGFDFDALINKALEPPWKPQLTSADDTQYFDKEAQNECVRMQREAAASQLPDNEAEEWSHIWAAWGDWSA